MAAASRAERDGARPDPNQDDALTRLHDEVADEFAACNRLILANMESGVALIPQLAAHIVAAGGKRIRPLLTLASAKLCDYSGGQREVALAACVEFIHTATLLHDDVVDESALRRGAASANAVFGNKASVLVGDFLFSRAFQLMTADGSLSVLRILSDAAATIAEGEVLQLQTQNDLGTTEDQYLEVIRGKTAALFAAACRVGAVVASRPIEEELALETFGREIGTAFQLVDDALDYAADEDAFGKTVGDDFREGKITLPVILAYHSGNASARAFWRRTIEESDQREGDLATAVGLMARAGAIETTRRQARAVAQRAKSALAIFPDTPMRARLEAVADYTVRRGA